VVPLAEGLEWKPGSVHVADALPADMKVMLS
jgi:hypothetical protein